MLRRVLLLLALIAPAFAANPNVILITLGSTRADRMGFLGSKHATPALDAIAKQSVVFEHAYAQAPTTVVSHAGILTGTYPQTNQATEFGWSLGASLPCLPDLLRARGYHTAAFVPGSTLASSFDRGFESYNVLSRGTQKGSLDDQAIARAAGWLARAKSPFFLWIHLDDASSATGASYDAAVSREDGALGTLFAALKTQKLYDDAAILVIADHGQSLGAHGEDTHGVFLYDETIQVPLLLKLPKNDLAAKRVPAKVALVNIAPTLLEVAGVPVPSQMQGQSLLRIAKTAANTDQPVYSRSDFPQRAFGWSPLESWRAGKYLYIKAPKPELYDLTADPGATKNLAQSSEATADTIAGQLDAFDRHFTAGKSGPELSSSEMQKLASLGYVGLQKSGGSTTAATGTDPKDVIATANKVQEARVILDNGDAAKAASLLQPIVTANPNLFLAQYELGSAFLQQPQFPKAIEHLHKAVELQLDSGEANLRMGAALNKTGDFKTAAVHLEIATGRMPKNAEAHTLLAQAYDHLGRAEDAKKERAKAGSQ